MALSDITPDILLHLYVDEKLTQKQIAERFGTHQTKVSALMQKWGVQAILKSDRLVYPPLTPIQHDVLFGSLLGDGTMAATGKHTARFIEGHCVAQAEYTRWKALVLEPFTSTVFETQKIEKDGRVFPGLTLSTHGCRMLRPYYDMFYSGGARVFPKDTPERMTPLVLAVWYMDDGSIGSKFHPRIAFGLDERSLGRSLQGLRRLGLKPVVHRDDRSETMMSIEFPDQADEFYQLVRPHIIPALAYKVPTDTPRRIADRIARALTPEHAVQLYSGGMSATDIAKLHRTSLTTVRRRLDEVGHVRRMGRPRKTYDLITARAALGNYDPAGWPSLDATTQEQWVQEVFEILRRSPFPVGALPVEEVLRQFQQVIRVPMILEENAIRPWSTVGGVACSSFFPNRYRASYRGRKTAYEQWHTDAALCRAIRFQFDQGDPVLPHRVLRAVTMQSRTPTVFRPTVSKWICQTYCPSGGTVWDPCSGYGGRLMGAVASGVQYMGTDVEPETVEGNKQLAKVLGATDRCHVILCRAEEYTPPPVDLVFTSPPYFDLERYSESEGQSYQQHPTYMAWVTGFLRPVVEKAYKALSTGGHLVLNVADKKGHGGVPLVQTTKDVAKDVGFMWATQHEMPLPKLNRGATSEPVLVFRRV